jgi:carboxypeptidase PM20D1
LRSTGVHEFEFILDEGPFILDGVLLGTDRSVAMIGVTEKGFLNVKLTAKGTVGHSSVPPLETSIVSLSRAVSKFGGHIHPNNFGMGLEKDMIEALAPYCTYFYKVLFANLWLFGPIVSKLLEKHLVMNSYVRTTTAVTMFKSGVKVSIQNRIQTIRFRCLPIAYNDIQYCILSADN